MDLQLTGKTAFISGSTGGIGFGVARWLVREGVAVILNGRTTHSVQEAVAKLQAENPEANVSGLVADFSKVDEINAIAAELTSIDILINNVGIFTSQSFFETTDDDWLNQFEVNVMSGVRLSRVVLPYMLKRDWGRILFISSECASLVPPDLIAYSMTKSAMQTIAKGLAQLTKDTSVTVNAIVPGSTLTEGADNLLGNMARLEQKTKEQVINEFFTNVRTSSLLQRFATLDEVASMICYLASPLSSATNGAVINVDGGSTS